MHLCPSQMNFIKVLAGILITTPEPPREITEAVKVVMRDLMNDGPAKQGYFSYLTTSVLRVYSSPLKVQVDNMFNIIIMMSDAKTPVANSSRKIQEFMLTPTGFVVYADIENYITNLFQPIVASPSTGSSSSSLSLNLDSLRRPANSGRPTQRQPLWFTLKYWKSWSKLNT